MSDPKKKQGGGGGSIIKLLLLLFVVAVVAFVGYGFTLDAAPHYERSIVIKADPDDVHEWTGDLKKWDEWGPWREQYPDIKYTYTENTTEVGGKSTFVTTDGTGSMTIDKTDPDKGIWFTFTWDDYPPSKGYVTYTKNDDGTTKVTWAMDSADAGMNLMYRYAGHFMRGTMEEMFDKGLGKLKTKVEAN